MKKNRKTIFVTGASGFIGGNFLKKAKTRGFKIYALSRKKKQNYSKDIFWIKGELDDNYDKYLKQSHTLIHFAAAGVNNKNINFQEALRHNVKKPYKLLKNCLKNGCKKWIIIGSASEYGSSTKKKIKLSINTKPRPVSNYEKSKYMFSKKVLALSKKHDVKCRLMRLFNVYGEGDNKKKLFHSINQAIKKKIPLIINSSSQIKDFIEIEKVTDVLIDCLNFKKKTKKFPQIWHVASGREMSVKKFVLSKIKKNKNINLKFENTNKTIRNFISSKKFIWKI